MPDLKRVLNALDRKTLLQISQLLEIKGASVLNKNEIVYQLARKRSVSWQEVLGNLDRDTLKRICWSLGVDAGGRRKQILSTESSG